MSSGTLQRIVTAERVCGAERDLGTESVECAFAGDVDLFIDPEVRSSSWTCPQCGDFHLEACDG